ncbi:hypothetical protein O181_120123 [Austropuccinia psidii MF-1]|uniref:Reverse transcriptase/retrotransposon-derived protein RNase H-like domain-containing protein n=1 Tax=Austropuccinia psidii MF-1 TaxID=1389203 RepID=A0A9Q3KF33_9BASI|nr:hypothetical protein [Austropuccinia psidii MF-1]
MVFSKYEEEHVTHVSTVLSTLRANNLFAKDSKCLFHVSSIEYLDYVVSSKGLKMDQEKFQQILNWPPPRNLKALQSFLGFTNFYGRFIKNYSKKISSLTNFLKKDSCFPLNEEVLSHFHQLKEAFTTAPILSHFNPSLPTIIETDAPNYALGHQGKSCINCRRLTSRRTACPPDTAYHPYARGVPSRHCLPSLRSECPPDMLLTLLILTLPYARGVPSQHAPNTTYPYACVVPPRHAPDTTHPYVHGVPSPHCLPSLCLRSALPTTLTTYASVVHP